MVDVVCLGELLIDFVSLESGVSLEQAPAFQKAPVKRAGQCRGRVAEFLRP